MACFVAPVAEAIVVSVVKRSMAKKERKAELCASGTETAECIKEQKESFTKELGWLSKMLWGGSFLLAVEHIWHGEVVPWPPFLTAMSDPGSIGPMLLEIATVGVGMALLITAVWGGMVLVSRRAKKRVVAKEI